MKRPFVISIAGFDPSAGAGILADIKCFEQHQTYGFGVCSALTVQTDDSFTAVSWLNATQIITQLQPLLAKFQITACKIGLIKDLPVLQELVNLIKRSYPKIKLVLDPILKASSGFNFHNWQTPELTNILKQIDLVTPNYDEMISMSHRKDTVVIQEWVKYCPVLLKGGHNPEMPGTDFLFEEQEIIEMKSGIKKIHPKHGSGCVLSAAITANLALGYPLKEACIHAKAYTERFLISNHTLLGYHYD